MTTKQERGLYKEYCAVSCQEPKDRRYAYSRLCRFFEDRAPDLLARYQAFELNVRNRPTTEGAFVSGLCNGRI